MTTTGPQGTAPRGRTTRQKVAVDRALGELDDFVSAQELHQHLKDAGDRVSLATVYRTLQQQLDEGRVDVLRREDGESVYRRCVADEHHHHLVCRRCWKTVEITAPDVEEWAQRVAQDHGYTEPSHTLEVTGLCAECSAS